MSRILIYGVVESAMEWRVKLITFHIEGCSELRGFEMGGSSFTGVGKGHQPGA